MKKIKTAPTTYEDKHEYPIAGVDEAGRGPIAGPVVACALILPKGRIIEGVNDSKQLSQKQRSVLEAEIYKHAVSYSFGIIEAPEIDEINILAAALKAMTEAIHGLCVVPKTVLVDGTKPPCCNMPVVCIKSGDSLSHTIAAASILAKEYRDRLMDGYHKEFPLYGFSSHKGYGTKKHFEAVGLHGLTPLHRKSFCKKYV